MKEDRRAAMLGEQRGALQAQATCCTEVGQVPFQPLGDERLEVMLGPGAPLIRAQGAAEPVPALGLELPEVGHRQLEVFAYSDRKRGLIKFANVLFMRPSVLFLDPERQLLQDVGDQPVCWGGKHGGGGTWIRFEVPAHARYAIVYPSLLHPRAKIDMRRGIVYGNGIGLAEGALINDIAEARQSYVADVSMGMTSLLGIELSEPGVGMSGPCYEQALRASGREL